jgi:hypothetical protein
MAAGCRNLPENLRICTSDLLSNNGDLDRAEAVAVGFRHLKRCIDCTLIIARTISMST